VSTTRVRRVLGPNPGPFTLEGTNTWLVGGDPCLVIDPGPDDPDHVERVVGEAGRVAGILLTHHHPDHAPGAAPLAKMTGAPVLALQPRSGEEAVHDGASVDAEGASLRVVATPGHTPDHAAFHDPGDGGLFTGDAVLGRGTSVVDPPEGDLIQYLRSLEAMIALDPSTLYPGHGPVVKRAADKLNEYLAHRALRERQVLDGLRPGARSPHELVANIYVDYPPELHPAAARLVLAHLQKLEQEGRVVRRGPPAEERFELAPDHQRSGPSSGTR
jgi:glyoxylase-like metal-dependent hydrolase (beta-lactamase superfamily II)